MCHKGDDTTQDKETAHLEIHVNPGDMNIVESTCELCHPKEVSNLEKSLHATSAGVISGARYTWGAQDLESIYSN
jgi:hypothetical protein